MQVKDVKRPVRSLLHWVALGDLVHVSGFFITSCIVAHQLIQRQVRCRLAGLRLPARGASINKVFFSSDYAFRGRRSCVHQSGRRR